MRQISRVLLLFMLLMLASVSSAQDDIVTLVVWGEPGPGCSDLSNDWEFCHFSRSITEGFEDAYPHIDIVFEEHGWDTELYSNLQEAILAGNAPDITIGETFFPQMIADGQLLQVDFSDEVRENVIPATVAYVTDADSNLYGMSVFTGIFTLEVNPDVFYAAGMVPEMEEFSTWESVLDIATRISDSGGGDYYGISLLGPTNLASAALFRVAPYIYQANADFCNMPACDTITLNDPNAVPVYQWLRDLYNQADSELVFNGDEGYVFSVLFVGQTAMQTAGSWHVGWGQGSGCTDCRYYPLPLPDGGEAANVVVGNAIYAGLASTEHPEEVQLFLEWLVQDEVQNQVLFTGVGGRMPVTYSAIENIVAIAGGDEAALELVPTFYVEELGKTLDSAPAFAADYLPFIFELVNSDVRTLPFWSVEMSVLWNEMFTEILTSDESINEIMDRYQAQAEVLVAERSQ